MQLLLLAHLVVLLLIAPSYFSQRIFIDQVSGYSALPPCSERAVSTIVQDMLQGCGDGNTTTSHISADAQSACNAEPTAVALALNVFGSYCAVQTAPA
jgi:hypothetical protein